jgi:hypothetical protein
MRKGYQPTVDDHLTVKAEEWLENNAVVILIGFGVICAVLLFLWFGI